VFDFLIPKRARDASALYNKAVEEHRKLRLESDPSAFRGLVDEVLANCVAALRADHKLGDAYILYADMQELLGSIAMECGDVPPGLRSLTLGALAIKECQRRHYYAKERRRGELVGERILAALAQYASEVSKDTEAAQLLSPQASFWSAIGAESPPTETAFGDENSEAGYVRMEYVPCHYPESEALLEYPAPEFFQEIDRVKRRLQREGWEMIESVPHLGDGQCLGEYLYFRRSASEIGSGDSKRLTERRRYKRRP
jgi:hypothetical protein